MNEPTVKLSSGTTSKKSTGIEFRPLPPRDELLRIGAKVLGRTTQQIASYGQPGYARTDAGDILVRLINRPGRWTDKLELIATERGGVQMMANTRIFELRRALKDHGLTIACLEDHSGPRTISSYRLAWEDEVSYRPNGRIEPFSAGRSARATRKPGWKSEPFRFGSSTREAAALPERKPPAQETLGFQNFLSHETGRTR